MFTGILVHQVDNILNYSTNVFFTTASGTILKQELYQMTQLDRMILTRTMEFNLLVVSQVFFFLPLIIKDQKYT